MFVVFLDSEVFFMNLVFSHVEKALNSLMKGVSRQEDMDEDDLEELVSLLTLFHPINQTCRHTASESEGRT